MLIIEFLKLFEKKNEKFRESGKLKKSGHLRNFGPFGKSEILFLQTEKIRIV